MLSRVVKTAPRLLQSSAKVQVNFVPICLQSTTTGKVIESYYKPSGNIPRGEDYHQIPVVINGMEFTGEPDEMEKCYPFVPSLEDISIEKNLTPSAEGEQAAEQLEPEFQVRTLEDKLKVWFGEDMPTKFDDQKPERDHVNFPRIPYYQLDAPATRLYFIPESWFKFFESKTGRTGGYIFGTTFITFLLSKELFVWNTNAHPGIALALIAAIAIKKFGAQTNAWLTSNIDKEAQGWVDWQDGMKKLLKDHLKELKQVEDRSINPELIYDAKRENLQLQQEAEYRRRVMDVYNEVKRKLDYQVAVENAKKNFTKKHLVNWVIDNVNKNINADLEKAVLNQCVVDLKQLSVKRKNAI